MCQVSLDLVILAKCFVKTMQKVIDTIRVLSNGFLVQKGKPWNMTSTVFFVNYWSSRLLWDINFCPFDKLFHVFGSQMLFVSLSNHLVTILFWKLPHRKIALISFLQWEWLWFFRWLMLTYIASCVVNGEQFHDR